MAKHRYNNTYVSAKNATALTNSPFQRLRLLRTILSFVMNSSILLSVVVIVHAIPSTHSSASFSVSQPLQADLKKINNVDTSKLLALNVGSSSIANSQPQPYAYKDDDFIIPSIKMQPRYMQRYLNPRSSQSHRRIATSSLQWVTLTLAAVSFSKALFQRLKNSTDVSYDVEDDNAIDTMSEIINKVEDKDIAVLSTKDLADDSSTILPAWKEQYDHLIVEASNLREQLSAIQQMLEKQNSEQLEAAVLSTDIVDGNNDIQSTNTEDDTAAMATEIQSLKESMQYWKNIAELNEQKASNAVQVERRNSIQQFELLKMEMLQLAEEERVAMMKEFTSMIQELRESLHSQT